MNRKLPYRAWFYFRTGWATYLTFVFAAINTLTVTYYLAIENIPILKTIFPTMAVYVLIVTLVGIPTVVLAGYIHFKKSSAYAAEADISVESNPHFKRFLINTEVILTSVIQLNSILLKISDNEKLSDDEKINLSKIQNELKKYLEHKTINYDDQFNITGKKINPN